MPSATSSDSPWRANQEVVEIRVDDRAVVALAPGCGLVRVGLVMPVLGRVVDISVQPSAACRVLDEAVRAAGVASNAVERTARSALVQAAEHARTWVPPDDQCLMRAFGGVAFPLLAATYEAGGAPVAEVPRWAAPALSAPTVGQGAVVAFGAAATRPVRRALVEAIRPLGCGQVDLTTVALALMGRDVLQPDRLARVLGADRVLHPPSDLPDPATLDTARRVLRAWGDVRTERVLVDVAARADGLQVLADTVRYARELGDHGPSGALPSRLTELHDAYRSLVRSDGGPPPPRARRIAAPTPRNARHQAAPAPPHRMLAPPTALGTVRADTVLRLTPSELALDGRGDGSLRLVLPRTVGDLTRWGRLLGNCLGDFGPAVAARRSTIIGVQRANRLVYAVELTPGGVIRQFCGAANRAPRDQDRRTVVRMLAVAGVLDTRAVGNRPWMAGAA